MRREEAIKELKSIRINLITAETSEWMSEKEKRYVDACDMAIEALEREPCDDCISRQAVLDATVKRNSIWTTITNSKGENLEEIISQLPSVTPQPKMGRWIKVTKALPLSDSCIECVRCSRCGTHWDMPFKFCPNCGRKMIVSQENKVEE